MEQKLLKFKKLNIIEDKDTFFIQIAETIET